MSFKYKIDKKQSKTQKCTTCGFYKYLKYFGEDKRGKNNKKRQCNFCKKKESKTYRINKKKSCDIRYIASIIYQNMRTKHKKMGLKYDPEFSVEDIVDVLINKKCCATKRSFCFKNTTKYRINPFMASPDRIDNSKGYLKNNVRWTMVWFNIARQQYDIHFFKKLIKGVKW